MNLRLLLARHGETDWNQQARYQGDLDTVNRSTDLM
jgi:broad specificity phosphatase PhoE